MGQLVKLNGYEAAFLEHGHKFVNIHDTYYNIPYWFKKTDINGVFEALTFEELPTDMQKIINGEEGYWNYVKVEKDG